MWKRAPMIDDFPAPVLPTIPTFSSALIIKFRFFRDKGAFSLYRAEKLENYRDGV